MSADLNTALPAQFSIGSVLRHTIAVVRSSPAQFAAVSLVFVLLWHIPILLLDRSADEFSWWNFAVTTLGNLIIGSCAQAVLVYATLSILKGHRSSLGHLLGGLSFLVPVMVVFFIADLPKAASVLLEMGNSQQEQSTPAHIVLVTITYLLYVLWFAVVPAIIAEGLGAWTAMGRSSALTKGRRWPIFGLVLAGVLLFEAVRLFLYRVIGIAGAGEESASGLLIAWIATYIVPALATVFWAVATTVAYCSLRLVKEGARLEARAAS